MKLAYPNYEDNMPVKPSYNLNKWINAMKNIYLNIHRGFSKNDCFENETSTWDKVEKYDFEDWMKFYEGNNHLKYKKAQHSYYVNDDLSGYYLPNSSISSKQDTNNVSLIPPTLQEVIPQAPVMTEEQKRNIIEEQRKKLLSRLNSVEKLLGSHEGHIFSGSEFEKLLHSIYELKKQIQTINKVSLSTKLYQDLIIRQANILQNNGFEKSATFLNKFAQNVPGLFNANLGPLPLGSKIDGTGTLENPIPDLLEVKPEELDDDSVSLEQEELPDDIMVEAQEIENKQSISPQVSDKNVDQLIDSTFANITVNDVINKLEEISKIFQTREISRQLAIVDIMLDSLGLAAYFPMLAEAIHKSFETNQYCLTRIEDVLFRLRGTAADTSKSDLVGNMNATPESAKVKSNLDALQQKENTRKEMRQKIQDKDLEKKLSGPAETPIVEDVSKELEEKPAEIKPAITPVAPQG